MTLYGLRFNVTMKKYLLKSNCDRQRGMTLVELMIAMIILGIIASAGIPAMSDFFTRKNIEAIAPFFERSIKLARVEASQRRVNVRVRPTSTTKDWSQGWYLEYTDPSDNSVNLIKRFDAIEGGITFTSDDFDDSSQLIISPTGQANASGVFELYVPECVVGQGYELTMLLSGFIKKGLITCTI